MNRLHGLGVVVVLAAGVAAGFLAVPRPARSAVAFADGAFHGKMKEAFTPITADLDARKRKFEMTLTLHGDGTNVDADVATREAGTDNLWGGFTASGVASSGAFCVTRDGITIVGTISGTAPNRAVRGQAVFGMIPPHVETQLSSYSVWEFRLRETELVIDD
jgi:hypothetical protein